MITINAITAEFKANDQTTVKALMSTKPVQKTLASVIKASPEMKVSRADQDTVQDTIHMVIRIVDRSYTMANSEDARDSVQDVINTWAQKSRVAGIRGERLAVVSDMEQVEFMSENDTFDTFEVDVEIGTAVFYNARRVTVNFPANAKEFTQDLTNLFEHLTQVGAVDANTGVVVSHELYGEFHTGNTNTEIEEVSGLDPDDINEDLSNIVNAAEEISGYDDADELLDQLCDLKDQIDELMQKIESNM